MRSFFKYYFNKDKLSSNVAAKISLPKQREKEIIRLERHEIEKILNAAESGEGMSEHQRKILLNTRARDVAILSLLLGTGIRVSECVGLNVTDIDFETNAFTVTRKGGSRAILYFNDDVKEALEYYIEGERKALPRDGRHLYGGGRARTPRRQHHQEALCRNRTGPPQSGGKGGHPARGRLTRNGMSHRLGRHFSCAFRREENAAGDPADTHLR